MASISPRPAVGFLAMQKWLCSLISAVLLVGVSARAVAEEPQKPAQKNNILLDINLSEPFHTKTPWQYLITQDPDYSDGEPGGVTECFINKYKKVCRDYPVSDFINSFVLRPEGHLRIPLLTSNYGWLVGNGNHNITVIYAYHVKSDKFVQIYQRDCRPNNGEETRLIGRGPLVGDVILSITPTRAPYRYGISVYRLTKGGAYSKMLSYQGESKYSDGNSLAVIDAEMPEIERRLHLWKRGDPLPVPARMHDNCKMPYLRKGLEWCGWWSR